MRSVLDKKCHRESRSAMSLCLPVWCCVYSVLLIIIIIRAKCLEHSSCTGWVMGLKFALCNHPTPDVLSEQPRQQDRSGMRPSNASIQIVIIVAMYSRTLFVWVERRYGGM